MGLKNKHCKCGKLIWDLSTRCGSCCKTGKLNPLFGKPKSLTTRKKMSLAMKGEKNHMWAGNKVKYPALHHWVRFNYGKPTKCEKCKKDGLVGYKIHWANVSGKYLRVRSDWKRLCVSCHKKFDLTRNRAPRIG